MNESESEHAENILFFLLILLTLDFDLGDTNKLFIDWYHHYNQY